MKGARGLRLEAMTWPTLPKGGAGTSSDGNFLLSTLSAKSGEKAVALHRPAADFAQDKFPIADVLDDKKESGWAVLKGTGKDHTAVFEFKEPVAHAGKFYRSTAKRQVSADTRQVGDTKAFSIPVFHHAQLRHQGGECIICDFWSGCRYNREQG
jgi:hypothetical protein